MIRCRALSPRAIVRLDPRGRRLVAAARQLLGTPELTLLQSEAWSKSPQGSMASLLPRSSYDNQDQRMHMDYPNHYLTHPSPWGSPDGEGCVR